MVTSPNIPLKILILEDNSSDNELIERELKKAGFSFCVIRVDTRQSFLESLRSFKPDLILSDYSLPYFDGLSALQITRNMYPETPFIFVTGSLGEERAIETLRSGALDYVLKDNLIRLVPAVKRALQVISERNERKKTEAALRESEERYRILFENNPSMYFTLDLEFRILSVNSFGSGQLGYSPDELTNKSFLDLLYHEDKNFVLQKLNECITSPGLIKWECRKLTRGNTILWLREVAHYTIQNSNKYLLIVCEDISELKFKDAALRESEERFRSIYENASVGIFRFTPEGIVLMANPALLNMLSFTSLSDLKTLNLHEEIQLASSKIIVAGYITKWTKSDQTEIYVRENLRAIRKNKALQYIDGVVEDITNTKKTEEELVVAKQEAEKSDRLKSEFLAQMSHEIRTPINAILSFSGLLRSELQGIVAEDLKTSFEIIERAGHRITRTIDLILNMSLLQSGAYEYVPKKINLYNFINDNFYYESNKSAVEKGLIFIVRTITQSNEVIADEYTLSQIISNLIDNALKYTHQGKIEIIIDSDPENNKVRFRVIDTGIGISQEYMPYIFVPFSQEEQGYTRRYEGNGLGLTLVKKYCEINNAKLRITSTKGEGSEFSITFLNDF